jgi:LacI family transcriptional regulator
MPEKLTIHDIARLAGVSKSSVSRVLNHHPATSPELRKRVMQIIQEHEFVPNITATNLAGGKKTRQVGVLTPPLIWPSVPELMRGVAQYIEDSSYEIVLYSISCERDHVDILDRILSLGMLSGLLVILPGELSVHLEDRFHQGLPMVLIDDQKKSISIPWVGIDNRSGAYAATRHLLEQGHQRIAYIQGPQHYYCALERYQGYIQALQESGITPDPTLVFQGRFDTPSGRECASALFSRNKGAWPDAVFAGNDQMAYGVLDIAEQLGVRIPEQLALVGFDDNPFSAYLRPPLTTIRQPFSEMGFKAMELLLTMVDPAHRAHRASQKGEEQPELEQFVADARMQKPLHIHLPTSLIIRASSGSRAETPLVPLGIETIA